MPPTRVRPTASGTSAAGVGAVLAAVVAWGSAAVMGKTSGLSGLSLTFWRSWIATVAVLAVLTAAGRRLTLDTLRRCAPSGVLFFANLVLYWTAIRHTSIAHAAVIGALTPLPVMAVAPFLFGERVRAVAVVCGVVAVAGVALVVLGGDGQSGVETSVFGDLLAVAALLTWTVFFLVTKQTRQSVPALDYLAGMTLVTALVATPFGLAFGNLRPAADALAWTAALAIVPGLVGHGLMAWAHARVDVSVSSVLALGETVLATAAAAVFLDERVTGSQMGGIAVVVVAIGVLSAAGTRSAAIGAAWRRRSARLAAAATATADAE